MSKEETTISGKRKDGSKVQRTLESVTRLASWPTPTSRDEASSGAAGYSTESGRHSGTTLTDAAKLASWATPRVGNGGTGSPSRATDGKARLEDQVQGVAGWATPAARDYRHANAETYQERGGEKKGEQLNNQVVHLVGAVADADGEDACAERQQRGGERRLKPEDGGLGGFWADCIWIPCTDGKARPAKSSIFPLASRLSFKLGSGSAFEGKSRPKMLRGYGNAINPYVAAEFIKAAI